MRSRDREKKRAGKESRPSDVNHEALLVKAREFYHSVRQQNAQFARLFEQRWQELLAKLPPRGPVQ